MGVRGYGRLGFVMLALCAVVCWPGVSSAEQPKLFDVSGTWVVESMRQSSLDRPQVTHPCLVTVIESKNLPMYGNDRLTLRVNGGGTNKGGTWYLSYEGTYHHFHGWADSHNKPVTDKDFYCGVGETVYDLEGKLLINAGENAPFKFSADGTLTSPGNYEHPKKLELSAATNRDPCRPTGRRNATVLFPGGKSSNIRLEVNFTGDESNKNIEPKGCHGDLHDPYEGLRVSKCEPCDAGEVTFNRVGAGGGLAPRGDFSGFLREATPKGGKTKRPIPNGTIMLYRQTGLVGPRKGGETVADYRAYLEKNKLGVLEGTTEPDDKGRFEFKDVPILERGEEGGWKRVNYTVIVVGAHRTDKPINGKPQELMFESTIFNNQHAGTNYDRKLYLKVTAALGAKRAVARDLIALSKTQYGPVEQKVKKYLDKIGNGTGMIKPTPARIEGVRRAVWAERSVQLAGRHAKTFNKLFLKHFGSFAAGLYSQFGSTRSQRLSNRLERLKHIRTTQYSRIAGKKGFGNIKKADYRELQSRVDKLFAADDELATAYVIDWMKSMTKYVVDYMNQNLRSKEDRKTVRLVHDVMLEVIDAMATNERSGLVALAIKKVVEASEPLLWDQSPVSFAARTKEDLERSVTEMKNWSDNIAGDYERDREKLLNRLAWMNGRADAAQAIILGAAEFAAAFSTASDIFSYGEPIPQVATAKKISVGAKFLSQYIAFGRAAVLAFIELPLAAEDGVNLAFGMQSTFEGPAPVTGKLTPLDADVADDPFDDLQKSIDEIDSEIYRGDYADALGIFVGADSEFPGFDESAEKYHRWVDRASAAVRAVKVDSPAKAEEAAEALRELRRSELELAETRSMLVDFFLDLFALEFEGNDPEFDRREDAVDDRLDREVVGGLEHGVRKFLYGAQKDDAEMYPAVVVDEVEVVSQTSGEGSVAKKGDKLDVKAHVSNVSTADVSDVSAVLEPAAPKGHVKIEGDAEKTIGTIEAFDKSGDADTAQVSWTVTYTGEKDFSGGLLFDVNLRESGGRPTTFIGESGHELVRLDWKLVDSDLDTLPDAWEREHGLDPSADDSGEDTDGDGLSNRAELNLGTAPSKKDSDGDGIDDGEETRLGMDGARTNPRKKDTDGDGVDDKADGNPIDASTDKGNPGETWKEPEVSVEKTKVSMEEKNIVMVDVKNAGEGTLHWTARSSDDRLAVGNPGPPYYRTGEGPLIITFPGDTGHPYRAPNVEIWVIDIGGAEQDAEKIVVDLPGDPPAPAGADAGDTGMHAGDVVGGLPAPDGGLDSPGEGGDGEGVGGGCWCSSSRTRPGSSFVLFLCAVVLGLRRRRGAP